MSKIKIPLQRRGVKNSRIFDGVVKKDKIWFCLVPIDHKKSTIQNQIIKIKIAIFAFYRWSLKKNKGKY